MALAYGAVTQLGLFSQQYPPPLLPKPGKDNVRLQKLLKRTAKKKACAQGSQSASHFRSSLSPVDEASPDLEHSDHSTPPKTPETPFRLYGLQQPPRISVRPLYQHVASPYPQRAAYDRTRRVSPQMRAMVSHLENVSTDQGPQLDTSRSSTPELSETKLPGVEMKKASDPHREPKQARLAQAAVAPVAWTSLAPPAEATALTCSLTLLTPLVKPKSPRPTFKATEPSRSPKPMFDVPQIRMYTASTSFYESTKVPPVYDSTGLTAIATETPRPTAATAKQEWTSSLGRDSQKMPSLEKIQMKTEKSPADIDRIPPPSEIKAKSSGSDIHVLRPERAKTPAKVMSRALTPVFEISRANPLLFAVSPVTLEAKRARTSPNLSQVELRSKEAEPNGNMNSDMTPAAAPIHDSLPKPKPNLTAEGLPPTASQKFSTSQTPTPEPITAQATSHGGQRPKTPTSEATRLMTTSPGYKRPKTPTSGASPAGGSPVAFQRPKTPTEGPQKSMSGYRGLTPAEYAAHGGIKTYFPAFGFSTSQVQVENEVTSTAEEPKESQTAGEETMEEQSWGKTSTAKELLRDKVHVNDESGAAKQLVPTILISHVTLGTSSKEVRGASTHEASLLSEAKPPAKNEKAPIHVETLLPKVPADIKASAAKSNKQDPLKVLQKAESQPVGRSQEQKSDPVLGKTPCVELKASVDPAVSENSEREGKYAALLKKPPAEEKYMKEAPKITGLQRSKGLKVSGWSRLKKHMVVEQEEPKFPESDGHTDAPQQAQTSRSSSSSADIPQAQTHGIAKATKMWDAVLFQMFATEENIMHQIELNQSENQPKQEQKEKKDIPSFVYKLPVLLFSPKFDAKKLKEAASRPVTKISTVFEMGLIGRKGRDEEPKDFNRTAQGFAAASGLGTHVEAC